MRKVYVEVITRLIIQADEGVEIQQVINEMDYDFYDNTGKATIIDIEIKDYNITDSK